MMPANRRIRPVPYPLGDASDRGPAEEPGVRAMSRFGAALRILVGVSTVVGVTVGFAWLARRYVTTSPRFGVSAFHVVGNTHRAADAIVRESGLVPGANVFSVDLDAARARILADAWIADATLTRRLPGTIVVHVTERVAAALVAVGDLYLASGEGEPFKKLEPGDPVDLPLISGLTPESIADDRAGAEQAIRRGIEIAAEYERSSLARRALLEEVHVAPEGDVTLVVGHSVTQLLLGTPPIRRKLDEAARVMTELDKRRLQASAIMLDNEERPDRVVARVASRP
jgi:cell division protein FtsQ